MRIVLYELKKIWNMKIVLALIVFSALYFLAAMYFDIAYYPNGHPHIEDVEFCTLLTQEYGATLTQDEFEEFYSAMCGELVIQADAVIANDTGAQAAGIISYAALVDIRNNTTYWSVSDSDITNRLYNNPANGYILYRLDALENIKASYCLSDEAWNNRLNSATNNLSLTRWQAIHDTDENLSIVPWPAIHSLVDYTRDLAILVVFAGIILHAPLLTTDRLRRVRLLQYSSKQGRKLIGKQFAAVLLSSIMLTTVVVVIFGGIFATNGTQIFWNQYISSFNSQFLTTLPLTFGQYAIILVGMLYLWGIALSTLAFILSRFCSNYIPLIAGGVCICVAAVFLCNNVVFYAPLNRWAYKMNFALFEPLICGVLIVLGISAGIGFIRRERKIDIA